MGAFIFAVGYGLSIMMGGILVLVWIPREFKKAAARLAEGKKRS